MAIDFKSDLDAQAWALLEANDAFSAKFRPGNRIKDDTKAVPQRGILGKKPGEFPQIRIQVHDATPIARQQVRTFGMNSTSYTSAVIDIPVAITVKVVVTMIFDLSASKPDRFAAQSIVRAIWAAAYPKFGLAYVSGFSIDETQRQRKVLPTDQIERIVVTQTLMFDLKPMLSQLS